jgi:hypothetical protein
MSYVNHHEASTANEGYDAVIVTKTPGNRMARRRKVNIGKYGGGGSVTDRDVSIQETSFRAHSVVPNINKSDIVRKGQETNSYKI